MSDLERFIPAGEIAKQLGHSVRTIHKWSQDGNIPCYWVVSSWRYKQSEIDEWMKSNYRFNPVANPSINGNEEPSDATSWEKSVEICIKEIKERIGEHQRRELNLDQFSANSNHEKRVIDEAVGVFLRTNKYEINQKFKDRDGNKIKTLLEKKFEKGR